MSRGIICKGTFRAKGGPFGTNCSGTTASQRRV